jgi:peptidoglycan/LPS O-acetylase OafA/YrhL
MTKRGASAPRPYLKTHNAMRGLAALGVFAYHLQLEPGYRVPLGPAAAIVSRGYLWVDFFFILSGFVLGLNYLETLGRGDRGAVRAFLVARVARILPMHLFALALLVVLVVGFNAGPAVLGRAPFWAFLAEPSFSDLALQAFLVQIWHVGASLSWNIPSWSISAEMHIYLLLPAMALALRHAPRASAPALLCLAVLGYVLLALARRQLDILDELALLRCFAGFALGVALQQAQDRVARWRGPLINAAQALAVVALVALFLSPLHDIWLIPPFALLIASSAADRGFLARLLDGRPQQMLGHVSYSLYLLNFPVLLAADMLWPRIDPILAWMPETSRRVLWMAWLVLVLIGASRLTFRWIEGPLRDRMKALLAAGRSRRGDGPDDDPLIPVTDPAP